MELKEGMYVRTKKGIGRVTEYTKHESWGYIVKVLGQYSCYTHTSNGELSDVIKASHNLINLIEAGDYVNGVEVIGKEFDNFNKEYLQCGVGDYVICTFEVKDIKTILTKEQFESQKYIVESDD